jgi:hypothetical protein
MKGNRGNRLHFLTAGAALDRDVLVGLISQAKDGISRIGYEQIANDTLLRSSFAAGAFAQYHETEQPGVNLQRLVRNESASAPYAVETSSLGDGSFIGDLLWKLNVLFLGGDSTFVYAAPFIGGDLLTKAGRIILPTSYYFRSSVTLTTAAAEAPGGTKNEVVAAWSADDRCSLSGACAFSVVGGIQNAGIMVFAGAPIEVSGGRLSFERVF